MYFWTSDEHYGHKNIIKYCNRPFLSVEEMDEELLKRHNEVVKKTSDVVVHAGDFIKVNNPKTFDMKNFEKYLKRLNGTHIFIPGSHDRIFASKMPYIYEMRVQELFIVVCHYAMRVWPRSHFNSVLLHGHSHGHLPPEGKQWDVGVDNNNFYPLSFEEIRGIMKNRPDNFNLVKK